MSGATEGRKAIPRINRKDTCLVNKCFLGHPETMGH